MPIKDLWQAWVEQPLATFLTFLYTHLQQMPVINTIGAYGVAIIILTIIIRLALAPLQQFQLVTQRKTMVEQRKLAPQVAELRKKYKKDPQKLNAEMMKLYQEHGVNPLGGLVGCLPLIVQLPILTALYYVFQGFAQHSHLAQPFLFVPNLNENPNHHMLFSGVPIPAPEYLIFPLLAALTTLVQSRMLQMPPPPNPTEQEQQTQQMQRTMVWLSPLMIGYFALNVPAGLGLYWFVGNCVSIIQQSFVVGWGNVLPARLRRTVAGGSDAAGGPPPRSGPPPKKGPESGPKAGPRNGNRPKRPNR
ncbi:MAG TPA: YidC/Oxa1 family membrane protein insertase [Candidatus Dormibacteraeota bacterium]|nr:YidC/Oxa1 family membrane protein insertase [Candidatus Dormibacteraeota bacterium]